MSQPRAEKEQYIGDPRTPVEWQTRIADVQRALGQPHLSTVDGIGFLVLLGALARKVERLEAALTAEE